MLGRFLEVSLHAPDVAASLAFYESLGFAQAPVGDTHGHAYAVVTDGRIVLGLHARPFDSPSLTWVQPGLVAHAPRLQALGIEFTRAQLGDDSLHEIGFADPSGQAVALIEARTFSPPHGGAAQESQLGYFEEIGIPTPDLARSAEFWDRLGFVAFDPVHTPFTRVVASSRDLNIGLYDVNLPQPLLVFSDPRMDARIAALRERGHSILDRLPRGMDRRGNALLEAPEGSWLLLMTSAE